MDVEVPVRGLVKEACRLADSCGDAEVLAALSYVLHSALIAVEPKLPQYASSESHQGQEAAWKQMRLYLTELDGARHRLGPSIAAESVRAVFFWLYMEQWSTLLLSAVPGQQLKQLQSSQAHQQQHKQQQPVAGPRLQQLLAWLLDLAPAPVLLQNLVGHLSMVMPQHEPGGQAARARGAAVTAQGADLAGSFLARRFAEPCNQCNGVWELLLYLAAGAALTPGKSLSAGLGDGGGDNLADESGRGDRDLISWQDEASLRHLLLLWPRGPAAPSGPSAARSDFRAMYDVASIAALLVSVPDRAAALLAAPKSEGWGAWSSHLPEPSVLGLLRPEVFYTHLLQRLLAVLADPRGSLEAVLACRRRRLGELTAPLAAYDHGTSDHGDGDSGTEAGRVGGGAADDVSTRGGGRHSRSGGGGSGDAPGGELSAAGLTVLEPLMTSAAVGLLAEVLERMARRGYAATAADALLTCTASLQPAYDTCAEDASGCVEGIVAMMAEGGAQHRWLREGCTAAMTRVADAGSVELERLIVALLDRAASAGLAIVASRSSRCSGGEHQLRELELQQRREELLGLNPQLCPAALEPALAALSWLLVTPLAEHPAVSYILADRLLLSLQRPPLPLDCLQLLTALLPVAYPAAQPAAAAGAAAAAWGDTTAVTRTSVQRQAYLSQVLLYLLARLDKAKVEGTPGLLTGLLAGVSQRLGSPLVATQRQAMRVGRAFSLVLDPASDLFADMGDLGLAEEELWPGVLPRHVQWRPASAAAAAAACATGLPGPTCGAQGGDAGRESSKAQPDRGGAAVGRSGELVPASCDGSEDGDRGDSGSVCTATDSDDLEEDGEDEEEELRPLGSVEEMEGDPEAEAWRRAEPSSLQLRALAAALRKQDDVDTVLGALKRLEEVIRAAPDELGLVAPELVRSLLHCRVPEWAEAEEGEQRQGQGQGRAAAGRSTPAEQRWRSLVALLAVAPLPAGDALVPEVYSPHLDMHQRLTLLDALSGAAAELADPRVAPRLTQGPGGRPLLERPDPLQPSFQQQRLQGPKRPAALESGVTQAFDRGAREGPTGRRGPRTRVWAPAALRKRREQEEAAAAGRPAAGAATFRNRFADVALRWAAGLLREVDRVKHGVDLLGRDHQLLGRLLATLATFAEAASGSVALPPLANATLELIRSPQVHGHPEPYVRRAALLAAGQVLAQLPPAAVAGALLGGGSRATPGALAGLRAGRGSFGGLAERLEWVSQWCRSASEDDVDPHCRLMAQACVNLQADLASRSLAALQDAAASAAPLAPTLPTLDLAHTARMLAAASPTASLSSHGGGGGGRVVGGWEGSAAAALVNDVSAW